MKGIVLGGTASGVGKTVATLVVSRALSDAGYGVAPAKAGPDYIDPSHHAAALGRPSRTLDTWMQGVAGVRRNLARSAGDVAVVEGMMGLYDGSACSTAATAAALDLPVVLVVDASAGMESVGATALGFREYASRVEMPDGIAESVADPRVEVVGVIAQQAHGGRHEEGIRDALPEGIRYLGRIPPTEGLEIPDRHLGLHMGEEAPIPDDSLTAAAECIDTQQLLAVAREPAEPTRSSSVATDASGGRPTVAVADDAAFRFIYPAVRERLAALATVEPFAPVDGDDLPVCDAVYLPGGYPELHVAELSESPALSTIAERSADGTPMLGECGGLMALSESLTTTEGETYGMAGVLPGEVRMHDRYQALDHVELRTRRAAPTTDAGETYRGHEFHYSSHACGRDDVDVDADARFAFDVVRGDGIDGDRDGLVEYRTVGTYTHRHAACGAFDRLVAAARDD